jgi:hypothetical protein
MLETVMSNPTTKPDVPEAGATLTDEQLREVRPFRFDFTGRGQLRSDRQ